MNDHGKEANFQSPGIITIAYEHFLKAFTGVETSGGLIYKCGLQTAASSAVNKLDSSSTAVCLSIHSSGICSLTQAEWNLMGPQHGF